MHGLLLQREGVVGLLLGLVVVEKRGLDRVGGEDRLDRLDHVGDVLEPAVERPFARDLEVVDIGIGDVGRRAGIERRDRLRDHVLHGVLRKVDLDAGLLLELLHRFEQRVILRLVEPLDPPDGELLLGQDLPAGEQQERRRDDACEKFVHHYPPGRSYVFSCVELIFARMQLAVEPAAVTEYGFSSPT